MRLLLKNADLYTPQHIGVNDILIEDDKILNFSKNIIDTCEVIDCKGKIVCPMFVDGHEHLKDIQYYNPEDILNAGVATVIGCLANEQCKEDVENLIAITKRLKKDYGINAYCLAGSKNFTHDTSRYILENDCVVGIKTALYSNQRPKSNLSYEKLKQDAISTYNAGLKVGKLVQVHIHLDHPFPKGGSANITEINSGELDNLGWIDKIVEETGVPYSLFKLTHAQKFYDRILEYANKGCYIDYTAFEGDYDSRYDCLVVAIKNKKVDLSRISISSDLGILSMEKGLRDKETPITILNTVQKLVLEQGLTFEDVLKMVTNNALNPIISVNELISIKQSCKIMVLNKSLNLEKVIYNRKMQQNFIIQ